MTTKNNIRKYRKRANLTQKQVADAARIAEQLYQRYEYGTGIPCVTVGIKLAKILKTTVEELYPDEE